jgi:hypothetical protein
MRGYNSGRDGTAEDHDSEAYNPKVVGSNPTSATIHTKPTEPGSAPIHFWSGLEQEEAGGAREAPHEEAEAQGAGADRKIGSSP